MNESTRIVWICRKLQALGMRKQTITVGAKATCKSRAAAVVALDGRKPKASARRRALDSASTRRIALLVQTTFDCLLLLP